MNYQYLKTEYGRLAYHRTNLNSKYGIVFLCGLASTMLGTKATYISECCSAKKISFTRFNYFGHGQSDGDIKDGTISIWKSNIIDILKNVANDTPQILVGSSLGGWLMCLAALQAPTQVKAIVGLAAAPDFTHDMLSSLDKDGLVNLKKLGYLSINRYGQELQVTQKLIEDGEKNLVLNKGELQISCPVRLLHGMADDIVPYKKSIQLAQQINSDDVQVNIVKVADHNMKDDASLKLISQTIFSVYKSLV